LINNVLDFYDESLTYKRSVTSLEWSAKHPELLLAGYSKSEEGNLSDPHGLIALWSLGLRKKPEFIFNSQTEITSAILHKFNPKLIIGATYTGQVLVWDTRGKNLPVMKTPPGGKYHSHPIYCLGITGSMNSNNIISVSNDGVLCTWSLPNLSKATKQINLKARKRRNQGEFDLGSNQYLEEVGAIVMATQESETNNVMLGTDDSDIYQVYTHQAGYLYI
jgi:dynein intermediate chain